jgi:hypothetical protein
VCHVSKRSGAGGGGVAGIGAGVGEQCGDDARGGVGDGDHDGGLLDLGPVDAVDVERGGDDLAQGAEGFGEQSQRVGQFVDQGQVIASQRRGAFDGLEFGFDRLFLVIAVAELGGEPVADRHTEGVGLTSELADIDGDAVQGGVGLLELAGEGVGAGGIRLVLLDLGGGDEAGELGGAVIAERVLVKEPRQRSGEHFLADSRADVGGVVFGVPGVAGSVRRSSGPCRVCLGCGYLLINWN